MASSLQRRVEKLEQRGQGQGQDSLGYACLTTDGAPQTEADAEALASAERTGRFLKVYYGINPRDWPDKEAAAGGG